MNVREFRYVVMIAREGNISRAAEKLHVAQSSLSKFLSNLEKIQGYLIFDRSVAPLKPTELGREYIATAQTILGLVADLDRKIEEIQDLKSNSLRVGITITRSLYCLHEVLPLFSAKYSGVHVAVTEARTADLTERLLNGDLDIMIIDGIPDNPLIDFQVLKSERFYLATPPGYLPDGPKVFEHALRHLPPERQKFILLPEGTRFRKLSEQIFGAYGMQPTVEHTTQMATTAVKLCIHGLGLSFVSSLVKDGFESEIKPEYYVLNERFSNPVTAAYRKGAYLPLAAQPFIDVFKSVVNKTSQ